MKDHFILILTPLLMFSCEQSPSNNPEEPTKMSTKLVNKSEGYTKYVR
mgnify:CR=1 FL=1